MRLSQVPPPDNVAEIYDVLFYETEWYRPVINHHPRKRRAFGINTNIYKRGPLPPAEMRYFVFINFYPAAPAACLLNAVLQGTITLSSVIFCHGSALGQSCKKVVAGLRLAKFMTTLKHRYKW
jgi:hypothetical protein